MDEQHVTLREFETRLDVQREIFEVKLAGLQAAFDAYKETSALALSIAEAEKERRLLQMNEFRAEAVKDKELLMPRNVADERDKEKTKQIAEIREELANTRGKGMVYGAIVAALISFVLRFIKWP